MIILGQRQGLALQFSPQALSWETALSMGWSVRGLKLFDGGSVLISYIKSGRQFKVNDHRLKSYLTSKPPAPAYKVKLHLPEHWRTWQYHPRPISSRRIYFSFVWLKTLNLDNLGRHPKIILPFSFLCFSIFFRYRRTTLGKGAPARNPTNKRHRLMSFF